MIVSAFLSHQSADAPLVHAVALELARRGVTPWLDRNELRSGQDLGQALRDAIGLQTVFVLFVSREALHESRWVKEELAEALELERDRRSWIIPVFLGRPLELVRSSRPLHDTWLSADGDAVERLGVLVSESEREDLDATGCRVAERLAASVYELANLRRAREINLVLDQRGSGTRTGAYELPANVARQGCPTLVFRDGFAARSLEEVLDGERWLAMAKALDWALTHAINTRTDCKVRLLGDHQLAIPALVGRKLDRTTTVTIVAHNERFKTAFSNDGQDRQAPVQGGSPRCDCTDPAGRVAPPPLPAGATIETVALYVGRREPYLADVREHAAASAVPLVFVEPSDLRPGAKGFSESAQVMSLVADVVALVGRLRAEHRSRRLRLYTSLPNNVLPLLAANLIHVIDRVEFMEYRRDRQAGVVPIPDRYTFLPTEPHQYGEPPLVFSLAGAATSTPATTPAPAPPGVKLDPEAEAVVQALLSDAFSRGLGRIPQYKVEHRRPGAGSTAQLVVRSTFSMPFFIKVDRAPKIPEEAEKLIQTRRRRDLADDFRDCFPQVYATRTETPPYGYLMESFEGFSGFEKICFGGGHSEAEILRAGHRALDLLFGAYRSSRSSLNRPNLAEIYLGRIKARLERAGALDADLKGLMGRSIAVNGQPLEPPATYLSAIAGLLDGWTPRFTTFIHGDSHPENILVRFREEAVDVRFIDPKEWDNADYLFDMGKLIHYLLATGPAERGPTPMTVAIDTGAGSLRYSITTPPAVARLVDEAMKRIEELAVGVFADTTWADRFALSMASNLLGLPAARLEKGRRDSAFILYGEGLRWLAKVAGASPAA